MVGGQLLTKLHARASHLAPGPPSLLPAPECWMAPAVPCPRSICSLRSPYHGSTPCMSALLPTNQSNIPPHSLTWPAPPTTATAIHGLTQPVKHLSAPPHLARLSDYCYCHTRAGPTSQTSLRTPSPGPPLRRALLPPSAGASTHLDCLDGEQHRLAQPGPPTTATSTHRLTQPDP